MGRNFGDDHAVIEHDYVVVDSSAWVEARTAGEVEALNVAFEEFEESYRENVSEFHHVCLVVEAWLKSLGVEYPEQMAMVNDEYALDEPLTMYLFEHAEHGKCAVVFEHDYHWTSAPRVYVDSTMESAYWFDYNDYELYCPNGHGCEVRSGDVIDSEGIYRTREDVWPEGMFVSVWDDAAHAGHTHHDNDAVLCPECGACMRAAMTQF